MELLRILTIETPFTQEEFPNLTKEDKIERINAAAIAAFDRKSDLIREVAAPVIKNCVEVQGMSGKIIVPMTDGKRIFHLRADLQEAYQTECRSIVKEWHKAVLLVSIDELWKEHLRELDQLRQSVQNASYEQKDPLVIYKVESFHLFERMLNDLNAKVTGALTRGQIYLPQPRPEQQEAPQQAPKVERAMPERPNDYSKYHASKEALPGENAQRQAASQQQGQPQRPQPVKAGPKIGRNDPCPCGSGKKYKNCHGRGNV